jgi:heme-degrading monooxygenase HmoA
VLVVTRWLDKDAFDAWVASDAFKMAHGWGGGSVYCEGILRWAPTRSQ